MNDTSLTNAILELVVEQKNLSREIQELVARVDALTTMVINQRPQYLQQRNSIMTSKQGLAATILGLVVLGLVVLAIALSQSGCSDHPRGFDADDSSDTVDTADSIDGGIDSSTDSDSDSDADGDSDSDSDGDSDADGDSDTDVDSDSDQGTDTTPVSCPWECKPFANPSWSTCDLFEISDGGVPDSIHDWRFECDDESWCCSPWPPDTDDELAIRILCTDLLNTRCDLKCPDEDNVNYDAACYHAGTKCCILGGNYDVRGNETGRRSVVDDRHFGLGSGDYRSSRNYYRV